MGPVLGFRGGTENRWDLNVIFVDNGDGSEIELVVEDGGEAIEVTGPVTLMSHEGHSVLRYEFSIMRGRTQKEIVYQLPSEVGKGTYRFWVPPSGKRPRIAYASCNGFSDPTAMKKIDNKNACWETMKKLHFKAARSRYHLLLMGGDQIYSDEMWQSVPTLKAWSEMPGKDRFSAPFNNANKKEVKAFFFDTYVNRWSETGPADMIASVPSLMMWDDHDIFDGWGSYPAKQQNSSFYKGIYKIAHEFFSVFQLRCKPGAQPAGKIAGQSHFNSYYQVNDIGILLLDMRSERTQNTVIGGNSWTKIYDKLTALKGAGLTHLFVLSSIPVVHPDFASIETLLGWLPGQQELEDDLKDHWHSRTQVIEKIRFIKRLFDFARGDADHQTRVTILSGDVHVGGLGVLENQRSDSGGGHAGVINQLTSSAIVHPAPHQLMAVALNLLSPDRKEVDRGITSSMLDFPGTSQKYILARNWLSLSPDKSDDRIWAEWYVEGEDEPYTKVINPV